ncbi:MAG: hypothetical protein ABFS28_13460 [Bacteroidota bacterium]
MRITIVTLVFFFCLPILYGQTAEENVSRLKLKTNQTIREDAVPEKEGAEKNIPGSFNVSLGSSYSYMKGYGSGMAFFAAPTYTLPLTNRWSLHGGLIATRYQGFNGTAPQESFFPNSFSSFAVFVAGSYQMSDRLVLHGTGVKQLISAPVTPLTPYPMNNLSLGATYKLGNNLTIGATIHINNGYGYYSTPMNGYMFQPPYGR